MQLRYIFELRLVLFYIKPRPIGTSSHWIHIEVGVGILADCRSDSLLRFDLSRSSLSRASSIKNEQKSRKNAILARFWGYPEKGQKWPFFGVPSYQRQIFCRKCPNRTHLVGHDSCFSEKTRFGPVFAKNRHFRPFSGFLRKTLIFWENRDFSRISDLQSARIPTPTSIFI